MNAADTNVLVRLMVRDDPHQTAVAGRFIEEGVWVSSLVLAETTCVVRSVYGRSAGELAVSVEMILNEKHVTLEDPGVVEAALDLFRDCLILQLTKKAGHLPLGTFDRDLGRVPGVHRL